MARGLTAVAAGRQPADLVFRNGRWVNVCSGEILEGIDVAVLGSRIAYCGPDARSMIGANTQVIEVEGRYLIPGLLDAHVHVESSMLTITQFARAVLPHGTTGAFIDPHEIGNVLGLAGVRLMVDEERTTPMQVYVQVPSCVPSAPDLETTGGRIGPEDVAEALSWPGMIGLGEVMNYPGIAVGDEGLHAEIAETLKAGKVVGGHYASPDLGVGFHVYAAAGPSDCHEGTRAEDALARVRQGMAAMLRQGSASHNAAAQLPAITEQGIDPRHLLLCTDDRHPGTLLEEGHIDDVVRLAIDEGVPPLTAIQMATLNTAEHFGVARDVGCIAPGRYADILIVSDLERFAIDLVYAAGALVAERGGMAVPSPLHVYPKEATASVHLARPLRSSDFTIPAPVENGRVRARVIEAIENQVITHATVAELPIADGHVLPDLEQGITLLAVVERHRASGRIGRGFVKGFSLKGRCALASTVAHDAHNLIVVGTDPDAMTRAANRVAEMNGGVCLVRDDQVTAAIPLPIAGLMSDQPVEIVAQQAEDLHEGLRACGCPLNNAFMNLAFLALLVIPELRLTDLGLVDVGEQVLVKLFC